jgi:uncharacterized protein
MKVRSRITFGMLCLLIAVLLGAGAVWVLGAKLIAPANHKVPLPAAFQAQIVSIPGKRHLIAGWWVDSANGSPVVLLLHAVRADRSSMVSRAQLLMRHGFAVLLIDLQAHGETPGDAITLGLRESADVVAARDWIKQQAPGRRIGVIGCSLGGAAILLGPQPSGFGAVVLEAVYPRISRAVENRIRIRLGALAPILAPALLMQLQQRLHIAPSELEPIRSISGLGAPVLVVAGSKDEHTTLEESQELYDAASSPKSFWIVDGARHQDFLAFDPRGYDAHVVEFLMETLVAVPSDYVAASTDGGAEPASARYQFPLEGRHILPVSLGSAVLGQRSRRTPSAVTAYWQPTEVEIENLESRLALFLADLRKSGSQLPPEGTYNRQYIGIVSHGIRLIYGNYYSPEFGKDPGAIAARAICDGGPSLWGVAFDPKTNIFGDMAFNGGGLVHR